MKSPFLNAVLAKKLLTLNMALAGIYFVALWVLFQHGNVYLYAILLAGEVFHMWQLITLVQDAWDTRLDHPYSKTFILPVAVFITVAGEPVSVVRATLKAALKQVYPLFHIYVLNDGRVANKPNWREIEALVRQYDPTRVSCITRRVPGGAKAGNINHALARTHEPLVAILDCDHIPSHSFLRRMVGYFIDDRVAFVQSPQYYRNHTMSYVANAAWQQQTLFFGPICRGKDRTNSLFMCGTNMLIRREALDSIGGMRQESITEDLLTSIFLHADGWRSVYVPRILSRGLAPEDLGSYWQQQFRWARGSFEVLFKFNPLLFTGLTSKQRIQYLASVTYYLIGIVVLFDALLPLIYFYWGSVPLTATTMSIALIFVPYIFLTLYVLQLVSSFAFSFRAIAFSIASWPIYALAFIATLFRLPNSFKVTAKTKQDGNYLRLTVFHFAYFAAVAIGIVIAFRRGGLSVSLITNTSWALLYIALFLPFVRAALSDRFAARLHYDQSDLPAEELVHE